MCRHLIERRLGATLGPAICLIDGGGCFAADLVEPSLVGMVILDEVRAEDRKRIPFLPLCVLGVVPR